jgi:adenylosuccinate synthase
VCTAYQAGATLLRHFPASLKVMESLEPVWEEFEGWQEPVSGARNVADLPANARRYMQRLEELVETEIVIASIGPDRDQTILIKNPFNAA